MKSIPWIPVFVLLYAMLGLGCQRPASELPVTESICIASYNVSLFGDQPGEVARRLSGGQDQQAVALARVIQSVRPDVLLLCEIDSQDDQQTLDCFAEEYLNVDHGPSRSIAYPHRWSVPTNTGLLADVDLNGDGQVTLPEDAWGFGKYHGQYAMAVLSRFPIDRDELRSFQTFRWSDLPGALRPVVPRGLPAVQDATWQALRLSSKNHIDVPLIVNNKRLHLMACHPTPPVFDGPEDRNGKRNHDEIRFWNDYLQGPSASHLKDDAGRSGGFRGDEPFVIAGDLNSDPDTGDSLRDGITGLLNHPRVQDPQPSSTANGTRTALFGSRKVRVDYVLPSQNLRIIDRGVVWPIDNDPLARDVRYSDHRMVWVRVAF